MPPNRPPNRLEAMLWLGIAGDGVGIDGNYEPSLVGFAAGFRYTHRVFHYLDLGCGVSYWNTAVRETAFQTFIGGVTIRPFIPIGHRETVEIGATFMLGGLLMYLPEAFDGGSRSLGPLTETWTGFAWAVGPDVVVWLAPNWGLQLSAELTYGTGKNSTNPEAQGLYLEKDGGFAAMGAWVGGFAAF